MADSEAATDADTGVEKAPWWAWGFVAAVPLALLALFTPWFDSVPPSDYRWAAGYKHATYSAWTVAKIGILCPLFIMIEGWQWWGALRGRRRPPSPSDWRGTGRSFSGYMAGGRVRGSGGDTKPEESWYPYRTGSWMSIGLAIVSLAVLGFSRALFKPSYFWVNFATGESHNETMSVHMAFGCWCYLAAVTCLLVTGIYGVLRPVTPWWEISKERVEAADRDRTGL